MLGAPELDAGLQVGSQENGVKGQNPLARTAGHAALDAAQDAVGFLVSHPAWPQPGPRPFAIVLPTNSGEMLFPSPVGADQRPEAG